MAKGEQAGAGCLAIFSLPFACVGAFTLFVYVYALWQWVDKQSWVPVPATILTADLESHSDSDGATYEVKATYEYSVGGQQYQSSKVQVSTGADNVGSFQKDAYKELKRHQEEHIPFTAFVDPADPSNAVLYRDLRVSLLLFVGIFAMVFGGVGFGLLAASVLTFCEVRERAARALAHPKQPWLHRREWANGVIAGDSKGRVLTWFIVGLVAAIISLPLLVLLPLEIFKTGNYLLAFGALVPAIGGCVLYGAIRKIAHWRAFGAARLRLQTNPARLGERFSATIEIPKPQPPSSVTVRLRCERAITTGSGDDSSTDVKIAWSEERAVPLHSHPGASATLIPIAFELVKGLPESGDESDSIKVQWKLTAKAPMPRIDLNLEFEIPVFKR